MTSRKLTLKSCAVRGPTGKSEVQDESLTYNKLVPGTLGFVSPEMFGAKGDGATDDTDALEKALNSGCGVVLLKKGATYLVTNPTIQNVNSLSVIGYGATIKVNKDFDFIPYLQRVCLFIKDSKNIKIEGITFDASWREIKELHNLEVDTSLENFCVRLLGGNDGVTFYKCIFGNQLKVCIQTQGSYLGGDTSDPANIDSSFVPNINIDIGYCTFGWNYAPGLHNGAIQFLELPQVATDINAKIHDNLMLISGVHGIHIYYGNNNVVIENNTVLNSGHCVLENYFAGGGAVVKGYGIEVTSCNKVKIINNYVRNFIAGGIFVFNDGWYSDGDIHDIEIGGNVVEQDTDYSVEFFGHAITVQYCKKAVINGNSCKNIRQARNNNSSCAGVVVTYSNNVIVSDNIIELCENGVISNYSDNLNVCNNTVNSLTNAFSKVNLGIQFYNANHIICNGNNILRGISTDAKYDGVQISQVENAVVSGNTLTGIRYAVKDNSTNISNVAIYGNIFSGVTNKYVWWGTHTDLVIDFVPAANT